MKRMLCLLAFVLVLIGISGCSGATSGPGFGTISVNDLQAKIARGDSFVLLDVRTPEEFSGDGHVEGAMLIPVQQLGQRMNELPKEQEIVCICRSGNRSTTACAQLAQAGFTKLKNVSGGMIAWSQAGYPIVK
ncbi:MAG: rhodanese-like domain-containing protein [Roseiflexaceae bacterium]